MVIDNRALAALRAMGGGGGGTGGAQPDYLAKEGEPGYILNRDKIQEKICGESLGEIIPLTEFTPFYYEPMGVPMQQLIDVDFVPGQTYTVIFDGVEYICEADTYNVSGISMNAIGNKILAGGEDTGEPFALFRVPTDDIACVITLDMNSHSVQVFSEVATSIEQKYLTNALPYYIDVTEISSNGVSEFECHETVKNVLPIFASGRPLVLKVAWINGYDGEHKYDLYAQLAQFASNYNGHPLWVFVCGDTQYGMAGKDDGTFEIAYISW